jgi:hypothetical protein
MSTTHAHIQSGLRVIPDSMHAVKPFYWPPFVWGAGQRKKTGMGYHILEALYVLNSPQKQSSHMML